MREARKEQHRQRVVDGARKACRLLKERFCYEEMVLIGSIASGRFGRYSDVDLVVKGLGEDDFFKAYSFLLHELSCGHELDLKPYELLDESFKRRIEKEGIRLE